MPDHWFFLSYARTDAGPYLDQFIADFATAVKQKVPLVSSVELDDVGFVDRQGLRGGEEWPEALMRALNQSRLLVALFSRAYFDSEYCGKELEVFRHRVAAFQKGGDETDPVLVLPVLWHKERYLRDRPPVAQDIHDDYGVDAYRERGLLELVKKSQTSLHDEYVDVIDALAERLVEVTRSIQLPPADGLPSLKALRSAFETADQQQRVASSGGGPAAAQLVYVAGSRDELKALLAGVDAYGDVGGWDWCPFYPDVPDSIGMLVQSAVGREKLVSFPLVLDSTVDLVARVKAAERENQIVLLFVDPWSAKLEPYHGALKDYDERRWMNSEVLVPLNRPADVAVDALMSGVRHALQRLSSDDSPQLRAGATSADAFERDVIDAINTVRARLMRYGASRAASDEDGGPSLPLPGR